MSENGGYIPKLATLIGKIMIHQWIGITFSIHPPGNSHHHRRSTSCLVSSQAPRSSEACCVPECPGCEGNPLRCHQTWQEKMPYKWWVLMGKLSMKDFNDLLRVSVPKSENNKFTSHTGPHGPSKQSLLGLSPPYGLVWQWGTSNSNVSKTLIFRRYPLVI
jgi:hypothetical protein